MADPLSGTGGGLRYITEEPTPDMVNQAFPYSCVVACVRQLLRDAGVDVSEAELVEEIGVVDGFGSTAETAAVALTGRHPRLRYLGGGLLEEQLNLFFRRDPWIAYVTTVWGTFHSVIVDGCDGQTVAVRDPWGLKGPGSGQGTRATLHLDDFIESWNRAACNGVVPHAIQ
jgi:predicted double-glycine peptidase